MKEEAEALSWGLMAGYVTAAEVIGWADEKILAGVPDAEVIDVSLGVTKPVDELARTLGTIRGEVNKKRLADIILRQMNKSIKHNPTLGHKIARTLYQMYLEDIVPSPEASAEMLRLDDSFDLAESGTWGTPAEAHAELVAFLSEWGNRLL